MIILFVSLLNNIGFAQKSTEDKSNQTKMTMDGIEKSLTLSQYQKIINKEFNSVINGSGKTSIGNYLSLDIKDTRLTFNATKNFKNGDYLSLNANGGLSDGYFAILNNSKLNSNVGLTLMYNMCLKSSSISYHIKELDKLNKKNEDADRNYNYLIKSANNSYKLLQSSLNLINAELDSVNSELRKNNLSALQKANYDFYKSKLVYQKDSIQAKIDTKRTDEEINDNALSLKKKDKSNAIDQFEYTGITMNWFSFGLGLQNNNFNLFDSKVPSLENQISKQNFVVWNASIEYNIYKWNQYSKPTYYLLLGLKGSIDDNFSDLNKIEISDTKTLADSNTKRTINKKINAFEGEYEKKLISAKFYIDFYRFFFKNIAAIHFFHDMNFKQNSKTVNNLGIGLLYSFKDGDINDSKTKVNTELYFRLKDISNNTNSDLSIWKRNELGIRLSIPVSFFNF